jgi:hypothetical protein
MNIDDLPLERELTEREKFFEETHERFKKEAGRSDNMILTVVKAQIIVERFMIALIEAHGRDPKHFFFTAPKITECKKIDPPEVGQPIWDLFSLCTYVRNELVHSLDNEQLKTKSDKVREAYLAVTENERQKQAIRDMIDTQMVTPRLPQTRRRRSDRHLRRGLRFAMYVAVELMNGARLKQWLIDLAKAAEK